MVTTGRAGRCRFIKTPSGVKIQELRVGSGTPAKQGDRCVADGGKQRGRAINMSNNMTMLYCAQ